MRSQNNFARTTHRLYSKHIRATEESKIICFEEKAFPSISSKCSHFVTPKSTTNKKYSDAFREYKMITFPRNGLIAFHISFFLLTDKGKKYSPSNSFYKYFFVFKILFCRLTSWKGNWRTFPLIHQEFFPTWKKYIPLQISSSISWVFSFVFTCIFLTKFI